MNEIRITGFELLGKMGEGGMASVWKARQISLERVVAIKILPARLASDEEDIARFQAEAQSAARLKHPGIVQVYDAGFENGHYYIVMEYVNGYTVGAWLRRSGAIEEPASLMVAECVADALEYAWERSGMVHCDIKPDNLMVDEDGTVKVADLGLARTISAMAAGARSEDVTGTPAYMSPEQAQGRLDLDCRSDIYSLGATMYHMTTGRFLFEGSPADRIVDLQVTDTVPDPFDAGLGLSQGMCWLLERMLAKSPADRLADWAAVKAEFARVRSGGMPVLPQGAGFASTLQRSAKRASPRESAQVPAERKEARPRRRTVLACAAGALVLAVCGAAGYRLMSRSSGPPSPVESPPVESPPMPPPDPAPPDSDRAARDVYESAVEFGRLHMADTEACIRTFREAAATCRGTKYADMATEKADYLERVRGRMVASVLDELRHRAEGMVAAGRFADAAALYEKYRGAFAEETLASRTNAAQGVRGREAMANEEARRRKEKEEQERRVQAFGSFLEEVAARLLDGKLEAACALAADAAARQAEGDAGGSIENVRALLGAAAGVDGRVLESFVAARGQEVSVSLNSGTRRLVVTEVRDGRVYGDQRVDAGSATAKVAVSFALSDLSLRERLQRMGPDDRPEVALVKGMLAFQLRALPQAEKFFAAVGAPLSDPLLRQMKDRSGGQDETSAQHALAQLLRLMGIAPPPYDRDAWLAAVRRAGSAPDRGRIAGQIRAAVANYRARYGQTAFGAEAEPILRAMEEPAGERPAEPARSPAPGQGAKKLPPSLVGIQGDGEAVRDELLRRNPNLLTAQIELSRNAAQAVTGLRIVAPSLVDISPVAALTQLAALEVVNPGADPGKWQDLAPLENLALQFLRVRNYPVRDLSALRGMPLTVVDLSGTAVRDLSDLRGAPIKQLDLSGTKVFDFSPLAGMPLTHLDLSDTGVKTVGFLRGKAIECLRLRNTRLHDLAPLADLPLRVLDLGGTQTKSVVLLSRLPLEDLNLSDTGVADLTPVSGMKLRRLHLTGTPVDDFTPLRAQPLEDLSLANTRFRDGWLLEDMPLKTLNLANTGVVTLDALKGKALAWLNIEGTGVKDVTFLQGAPLAYFGCRGTRIADFRPLANAPIRDLWIDAPREQSRFIRSLPQLRLLNGVDVGAALAPRPPHGRP